MAREWVMEKGPSKCSLNRGVNQKQRADNIAVMGFWGFCLYMFPQIQSPVKIQALKQAHKMCRFLCFQVLQRAIRSSNLMSHFIVFHYLSSPSSWVNESLRIPEVTLIFGVLKFPRLCINTWSEAACFVYSYPCALAWARLPWEHHEWWHHCSNVTSLLDGDSCLCCVWAWERKGRERTLKCMKMQSEGNTKTRSHSQHPRVLFYVTKIMTSSLF